MEPFIKWPGGKRRLAREIVSRMPPIKKRYFEPFAGGMAVGFHLLETGVPGEAIVASDVCRPLISTYQATQYRVDLLINILRGMAEQFRREGEPYYYRVREDMNKSLVGGRADQGVVMAARFLLLNRTGYNGLWRVNSSGGMNAPIGRYDDPDIVREEILREAARVLTNVRFLCAPYNILTTHEMQPGDVAYFDPPYYSGFTSYTAGGFTTDDQEVLANTLRRLAERGVSVVASNEDSPEVRKLYEGFHLYTVRAPRFINSDVNGRIEVGELIIMSEESSDKIMCRCGCETVATHIVISYEYDPTAEGKKGEQFEEPCCISAASYLREAALESDLPFNIREIKNEEVS